MHSSLVRLQTVFGSFTSAAFVVAGLIAASVVFFPQSPSASVSLRNVQVVKGRPHYYSPKKEEYAHIRFDLDADLTSLFNWNTKQLFVYVLATYPSSSSSPPSSAIIWDLIIPSPTQPYPFSLSFLFSTASSSASSFERAASRSSKGKNTVPGAEDEPAAGKISLKNVKPKYQITDVSGRMAERGNVTLEVGWNVQPWVGALTWNTMSEEGGPQWWNRWKGMEGGRSRAFDMPPLKGKKGAETTVVKQGGTPRAGKATPVV